jgi:hypothetical protein
MNKILALADLEGKTEKEIIAHIEQDYQTKFDDKMEILIAYESVGSWGCDSSSFFLLRHKETGVLYQVHGSRCSQYGFEDQWSPQETNVGALLLAIGDGNNRSCFNAGGQDVIVNESYMLVNEYVIKLKQ